MIGPVIVAILIAICKSEVQRQPFSCDRRPAGYYADVETDCQVYHMCDGLGRQFSYTCPNNTLFQQRMLVCDHWYMVNCSKSEVHYSANLLIGQRNKPFVEDSEKHPYLRTPRPDLLNTTEYNYLFKNGKPEFTSTYNLVGIETDETEGSTSTSNMKTRYSLPSHWFTTLYIEDATKSSVVKQENIIKTTENSKNTIKRQHEEDNFQHRDLFSEFIKKNSQRIVSQQRLKENKSTVKHELHQSATVFTSVAPKPTKKQSFSVQQWKDLKKMFLIPEYEFPLDNSTRPSYDSKKSSFDTSSLSDTSSI